MISRRMLRGSGAVDMAREERSDHGRGQGKTTKVCLSLLAIVGAMASYLFVKTTQKPQRRCIMYSVESSDATASTIPPYRRSQSCASSLHKAERRCEIRAHLSATKSTQ